MAKSNTSLEHPQSIHPRIWLPRLDVLALWRAPCPAQLCASTQGDVGMKGCPEDVDQVPLCHAAVPVPALALWALRWRRQGPAPLCPPSSPTVLLLGAEQPLELVWALPRATTEQPQGPACARSGQHPEEPWQPGVYFRGGRCWGSPGVVPSVPKGDTELPGTPGMS